MPAISALSFLLQVAIINISDKIFLMENSDFANVASILVLCCRRLRMHVSSGKLEIPLASCLHISNLMNVIRNSNTFDIVVYTPGELLER